MGKAPLSCPFVFAVGLTAAPGEPVEEIRAIADFYDRTHLAEVVAFNPGFVGAARYELTDNDPTVDAGPRMLALYGIGDEASARRFVDRVRGPAEGRPVYSAGPPGFYRAEVVWRMVWRNLGVTGSPDAATGSMAMVGMEPVADANEAELAEFGDFYGGVHVPEVLSALGYDRGTRFELFAEFRHVPPGCPRFCAVYERAAEQAPPRREGATLSPGPRAWEGRRVRWRAKYRPASGG